MKLFSLAFFLISTPLLAYVPTVESLFRNGSNPDVAGNALAITLSVGKVNGSETVASGPVDFYKVFFTKSVGDTFKVAQTKYTDDTFSENALAHKIHFNHFNASTIKSNQDNIEKGLFYGLLNSLAFNSGSHLIHYLKSLGVPVRLNSEIINRQKIEYLSAYKSYLVAINKDRSARKTLINPLKPNDSVLRDKIEKTMGESMYVDTKQVKLERDGVEMVWKIVAGSFEGVVSYKKREIQKISFKSSSGEIIISLHDYWLVNGTHNMPRYMLLKTQSGENYRVDIKSVRHYSEKDDEVAKRILRWDQILKSKDVTSSRPEFLL